MIWLSRVAAVWSDSVEGTLWDPVLGSGCVLERTMSAKRAYVLREAERSFAFEIMANRPSPLIAVAVSWCSGCRCMAASNSRGSSTCLLELRSSKVSVCLRLSSSLVRLAEGR